MKILIAGGAGFIGSHLCERLVKEKNMVVCVDNLFSGSKKNIAHLLNNKNFRFVEFDVLQPLFTRCCLPVIHYDTVYHLASPASPNAQSPYSYMAHPIKTLLANSIGTRNLLELAKKYAAKFIFASTSEVYGDPQEHPQSEEYWGNVNPNGRRSCYDEGKRFGEAITMAYQRKYKLDTRIVRIFNTYGPRMLPEDGRVISNFIVQALRGQPLTVYGQGRQTRSFCYVTDLVEGLVKLGQTAGLSGNVINLGNPDERRILAVAQRIKQLVGSNTADIVFQDLPQDDPLRRQPDISKANKLLGWKPLVSFEDGLNRTIQYFRKKLKL